MAQPFNHFLDIHIRSMIIMSPIVRTATEVDVEQLAPLFVASVDTTIPGVTFSDDPSYALDKIQPHLLKRLFPPRSRKTYVLELHTGEIVGYANVKPDGGPSKDEDELDMFFVKAGRGGQGYGGQLMEAVQHDWDKHGLWVHVFKVNERAIRFYERWGFRVVDGVEEVLDLSLMEPVKEVACGMRWTRTS